MKFVKYDPTNGKIILSGDIPEHMISLQGKHVLKVDASSLHHYIDLKTLQPVSKPEKPEGFYIWDDDDKEWKVDVVMAEHAVKNKRNQLLSSSDWTQLPDVPLATKESWAAYRQALRDIPDQPEFPLNVVWPDKENY